MPNDVSYFKLEGDDTTYSFNDYDAEDDIGKCLLYRGTLTASDDLDNIIQTGIYYINTAQPANMPDALNYCTLFVWQSNGTTSGACQVLMQGNQLQTEYRRRFYGNPGAWQTWLLVEADSGWKTLTIGSDFELYTSGSPVQYRKVGKMVEVCGAVKPTSEIASGGTATIGTLPSGYYPSVARHFVCQGSGKATWCLTVGGNGALSFGRYGAGANEAAGTSVWLPFNATFGVG